MEAKPAISKKATINVTNNIKNICFRSLGVKINNESQAFSMD